MLLEEIKNIKSQKRDLRNFGLVIGIASGILGGLLWWKGKSTYPYFMISSLVFIFCGITLPAILKPLQKVWMTIAVIMGWFMTRLILGILFYIIFSAIGIVPRLFGKKFLDLEMSNSKNSYWINREKKPIDKRNYERQF